MNRRDLIQIAAAAAVTSGCLDAAETGTLETLAEIIVPGAKAARVPWFIDTMLANAPAPVKEEWKSGLAAVAREFASKQPLRVVEAMARGESAPKTELERFFVTAKRMVVEGYVMSEEGARYFGVSGHHIYKDFPGCTHKEHQP
ncbi:MAG: gluconate 2-dehydrogenase subunit 3 family protein [Bryobacteraceae bacterium]